MDSGGSTGSNFLKPPEGSVDHLSPGDNFTKARYVNPLNKTTVGFERANWNLAMKIRDEESNRYYKGK